MKPTTILVSALSALAAAAVPTEKRTSYDLSSLNNLDYFNSAGLDYLLSENELELEVLATLGSANNFNILSYESLFQSSSFNINDMLQLQQLQILLQLAELGLFNGYDLSSLELGLLQLGLLGSLGSMDLGQFVEPSSMSQIQSIAAGVVSGAK